MLVPLSVTVDELTHMIRGVDNRVVQVSLIDMFQKKDWKQERALTFRYLLRDPEKTMTKKEAQVISDQVITVIQKAGASVR